MPKFKLGDKVKIIGNSCGSGKDHHCCQTYKKEFPYMIIDEFRGDKIHIHTPRKKLSSNGCFGCSGFKEADLVFFNQSMKELLE